MGHSGVDAPITHQQEAQEDFRRIQDVLAVREYDYLSSSVSFCGIPESLKASLNL